MDQRLEERLIEIEQQQVRSGRITKGPQQSAYHTVKVSNQGFWNAAYASLAISAIVSVAIIAYSSRGEPKTSPPRTQTAQTAHVCEEQAESGLSAQTTQLSSEDYLHLQFYQNDQPERETLLAPGSYRILKPLQGHYWELGPDCTKQSALEKHVNPSIQRRRAAGANTAGYVESSSLLAEGILQEAP